MNVIRNYNITQNGLKELTVHPKSMRISYKTKHTAISILGIYSREMKRYSHKMSCSEMFTENEFIMQN
jgi:hypothetical protein